MVIMVSIRRTIRVDYTELYTIGWLANSFTNSMFGANDRTSATVAYLTLNVPTITVM